MAFIEPMHRNKPNITYLLTGTEPTNTNMHPLKGLWLMDCWPLETAESGDRLALAW